MLSKYLLQKDFWVNTNMNIEKSSDISGSLKQLFREQIRQLRNDIILQRLHRWELSTENQAIRLLREKREQNGNELIRSVSELTHSSSAEIASLASIISAAISYLVLMENQNPVYNGIDLHNDRGWEQIVGGIDLIIDLWIKYIRQ